MEAHTIEANTKKAPKVGGISSGQLRSIIERVERLESEKTGLAADIRDVFAEAKGNGYDVKSLRAIIKMRKKDASELEEEQATLDVYMMALGMVQSDLFDTEITAAIWKS